MSTQTTNNQCNAPSTIAIPIWDYILTPLSCASLINEVLKNLLYQRSQIPYPYTWLKSIISKKRHSETEDKKPNNFTLNRHFRVASTAYDATENIMTNISKHFVHFSSQLKEVVFVIGSPLCPKEIITVKVSSLVSGHFERNHVAENSTKQSKILRKIFLTESWMNLVQHRLSCSSTYVFLRVRGAQNGVTNLCGGSVFVPSEPLFFPSKVRHTVITLDYCNPTILSCCDNLQVFSDSCDNNAAVGEQNFRQEPHVSADEAWFQSKVFIQGFKDCFINKVSACELW